MLAAAEPRFALDRKVGKRKQTLGQMLNEAWQTTGKKPDALSKLPPIPPDAFQVWRWFQGLHRSRQGEMGLKPFSWSDIGAYMQARHFQPEAWEYEAIEKLDDLYLKTVLTDENYGIARK